MWFLSVDSGSLMSAVKMDGAKYPAVAKRHGALDPDEHYLVIRSRIEGSIKYLVSVVDALYKGETPGYSSPVIDDDKSADYRFRTVITADEFKRYMAYEIDGIDFSSHVKEETVRRQPEPKVANLYSALIATWSAWSKLQPTAPYSGRVWAGSGSYSWVSKPDCKNCAHKEYSHDVKGTSCRGVWDQVAKKMGTCDCKGYEPKETAKLSPSGVGEIALDPPALPVKSARDSASAFFSEGDFLVEEDFALSDADGEHENWCTFWDGDVCVCQEGTADLWDEAHEFSGSYTITKPAVPHEMRLENGNVIINGAEVEQEPAVAGESREEKRARVRRNKRARQRARKQLA